MGLRPVSEFCREICPFRTSWQDLNEDCKCLDDKIKCPVDYFMDWLKRTRGRK